MSFRILSLAVSGYRSIIIFAEEHKKKEPINLRNLRSLDTFHLRPLLLNDG